MKTNIARIISLLMVLLMVTCSFTACKKKKTEEQSNLESVSGEVQAGSETTDYYTVAEENNTIVVKVLNEDGTYSLDVLSGTTVEQFFTVVKPIETYGLKICNADGSEVTDTATVIAEGMYMKVVLLATEEGGEDTEIEVVAIKIVSQEELNSAIESTRNNPDGSNPDRPAVPSTALSGYKFVLGSINASKYYENSTAGNAYKAQIDKIKRTYGCDVEYRNYSPSSDAVVKEVMAGTCPSDVIELDIASLRNVAKQGCCIDVFSTSIDKKAYATGLTESCTYGGKAYGVAFSSMSTSPMGVIYNKQLINQYASGTDIAALYDNKQWTFDKFEEIAKACTRDTNADGATDIYGFTSNTNIIGMAITSNAGGTATRDSSGKIVATMCTQPGIKALEWMKKLYQARYWKYNSAIETCVADFSAGKAAMFVSDMYHYGSIAPNANFDMGFVLMPIGPDQKDYITGAYSGNLYMIPKNKESTKEASALFLNQLANVSGKILTIEMQNMRRNGLDAHSANVYKYAVSHTTPEFRTGAIGDDSSEKTDKSVLLPSQKPATVIASIKGQIQSELDSFYNF